MGWKTLDARWPRTVIPERWEANRRALQLPQLPAMSVFPGYGTGRGAQGDSRSFLELKRWSWESRDIKVISGHRRVYLRRVVQVESPEMWRGSASDEVWADHACAELFEWREPFRLAVTVSGTHVDLEVVSFLISQIGKPQNSWRTKQNTQESLASVAGNKYP